MSDSGGQTPHAQGKPPSEPVPRGPLVIGLAGGIGSGKSSVAAEFAKLGWVIYDADIHAREALQRPEVRKRLIDWWGEGILAADQSVDRSAVAKIVFARPQERLRLEALIHPLVARTRAQILQALRSRTVVPPGAVYDAPLLFEAGLDRECDAVIFVDAPREVRLERARRRGWDEIEWSRREAAQWPVDRKRALSRFVIHNDGGLDQLASQCQAIEAILTHTPELGQQLA